MNKPTPPDKPIFADNPRLVEQYLRGAEIAADPNDDGPSLSNPDSPRQVDFLAMGVYERNSHAGWLDRLLDHFQHLPEGFFDADYL